MATLKVMLDKILDDLDAIGNLDASAIVSRDGLLMVSHIRTDIPAETFAAMTATMLGAAETAIVELGKGKISRVIVESEKTKMIACGAGSEALIVAMVRPDVGLGLVLMEMAKAADKVKVLLPSSAESKVNKELYMVLV